MIGGKAEARETEHQAKAFNGAKETPRLGHHHRRNDKVGHDEIHKHEQNPRGEPPDFTTRSNQYYLLLPGRRSKSAFTQEEPMEIEN